MPAGRPKGARNKTTVAMQQVMAERGDDTPLAYMLRVMSDNAADDDRRDEMAKAAAPYCHSRLATVEHTGKDGGKILIELVRFTDDEDPASA